jgi:AcrR family transcriptional regulator
MASPRTRNATQTRADILAAARVRFGSDGYERTTLRAVAADVGVDPALVIRYFGSKQDLFAAAAEFTLDLPDLRTVHPDDVADALLPSFFASGRTTYVRGVAARGDDKSTRRTPCAGSSPPRSPPSSPPSRRPPGAARRPMGAFVIGWPPPHVLANPAARISATTSSSRGAR